MVQVQLVSDYEILTSVGTLSNWYDAVNFYFVFTAPHNLVLNDEIRISGTDPLYDGDRRVSKVWSSTIVQLYGIYPGGPTGTGGTVDKVSTGTTSSMLTVKENTPVPINRAISDIKDPSSRKGGYTKTVTLVGDNATNTALGNIFNINIVTSTFNRFAKTLANIIQDDAIVFTGYMRLLSINKRSPSNDTGDQEIEYEVTVADGASSFFQALGDIRLTDLAYEELNHPNNVASVIDSIQHTYLDGYKYGWPIPSSRYGNYQLDDFLLCIYAKNYWDKIFAKIGFSYTWDSMFDDNINFHKLLIPYNGSIVDPSKLLTTAYYNVEANDTTVTSTAVQIPAATQSWTLGGKYIVSNELIDPSNSYNNITGVYAIPYNLPQSQYALFKYTIEYQAIFTNNEASTIYLRRDSEGASSQSGGFGFSAKLMLNAPSGIIMNTNLAFFSKSSTGVASNSYSLPPGDTVMWTSTAPVTVTMTNNYVNYPVTTEFTQSIGFHVDPMTANQAFWSTTNAGTPAAARLLPADLDFRFEISAITLKITPPVNVDFTGTKLARFYVPKNVKAKDFIKSILTMYNLYAEVDVNTDKHIIFKTRDAYYDDGDVWDWTDKQVQDMDSTIAFASEESNKTLKLTYKTASDEINVGYTQATNEVYGEAEFVFTDENIKGDQKMAVTFEPMPIIKNDLKGIYVLGVKGKEPKTGVRIVYDGGVRTCTSYDILQGTTVLGSATTYNYAGHFDDPISPTFDLNFNMCQRYLYYDTAYFTNNNLFNMHWRRNIEQIDKGRVMMAHFNLTQLDVMNTKLNDRIWIKDAYWNILNINDYDAGSKGPTSVKLITVDETQTLSPFSSDEPPFPFPPPLDTLKRAADNSALEANFTASLGTIMLGENNFINPYSFYNLVLGDENVITGTNNLIIGAGLSVDKTKAVLINDGSLAIYTTKLMTTSPEIFETLPYLEADSATESFVIGRNNSIDGTIGTIILGGDNNVVLPGVTGAYIVGSSNKTITGDNEIWIGEDVHIVGGVDILSMWTRVGDDIVAKENEVTSPLIYPNVLPALDKQGNLGSSIFNWNSVFAAEIKMTSAGSITSQNGGGQIELDFNGNANNVILTTDGGAGLESTLQLQSFSTDIYSYNHDDYAGISVTGGAFTYPNVNIYAADDIGTTAMVNLQTFNGITLLTDLTMENGRFSLSGDDGLYYSAAGVEIASIDAANSAFTFGFRTGKVGVGSFVEGGSGFGNENTASGINSHAEGATTTASGNYSHAEGYNTTASGNYSHAEGDTTTASGNYSHAEGYNTTASGHYSHGGGHYSLANHFGESARGLAYMNVYGVTKYSQHGVLSFYKWTENATPAEAFLDSNSLRFTIASGSVYDCKMTCLAVSGTGDVKNFSASGIVKNIAGTTSLVGAWSVTSSDSDVSMAATTIAMTADNTNDALVPTVTGIAATDICWYVKIEYNKIIY